MACELVTGHTGAPHVTAAQAASLHAGILGRDTVILDTGNKLTATLVTSNSVQIDTGDAMIQGRQVSCSTPTTLQIASGSQGVKRIDYIAVRYTMDAETGIENAELVVLQGTPSASPQPPDVVTADIDSGATVAEFPLWSIAIEGITPKTPQRLVHDYGYLIAQGKSNGWAWEKYSDGRMTMRKMVTFKGKSKTPYGSLYEILPNLSPENYPVPFIAEPNVQFSYTDAYGTRPSGLCGYESYAGSNTRTPSFYALSSSSSAHSDMSITVYIMATGRWK